MAAPKNGERYFGDVDFVHFDRFVSFLSPYHETFGQDFHQKKTYLAGSNPNIVCWTHAPHQIGRAATDTKATLLLDKSRANSGMV